MKVKVKDLVKSSCWFFFWIFLISVCFSPSLLPPLRYCYLFPRLLQWPPNGFLSISTSIHQCFPTFFTSQHPENGVWMIHWGKWTEGAQGWRELFRGALAAPNSLSHSRNWGDQYLGHICHLVMTHWPFFRKLRSYLFSVVARVIICFQWKFDFCHSCFKLSGFPLSPW